MNAQYLDWIKNFWQNIHTVVRNTRLFLAQLLTISIKSFNYKKASHFCFSIHFRLFTRGQKKQRTFFSNLTGLIIESRATVDCIRATVSRILPSAVRGNNLQPPLFPLSDSSNDPNIIFPPRAAHMKLNYTSKVRTHHHQWTQLSNHHQRLAICILNWPVSLTTLWNWSWHIANIPSSRVLLFNHRHHHHHRRMFCLFETLLWHVFSWHLASPQRYVEEWVRCNQRRTSNQVDIYKWPWTFLFKFTWNIRGSLLFSRRIVASALISLHFRRDRHPPFLSFRQLSWYFSFWMWPDKIWFA